MASVGDFVHEHVPAQGRGAGAPTLLLLHGTGGDERDLLPVGRLLADDAALLSPRGQVLEGPMPRWFRRLAEGVFDTEDLVRRTHELADWVPAACAHHELDPDQLIAAGFSNGANIAGAMLLLRPEVLRAAILLAPMVPLRPERLPDLSSVAVFINAGRADPICPPDQAEELAGILDDAGAAVEVRWHSGGHGLDRPAVDAAAGWLRKVRWATGSDGEAPLP